MEAVQLGLIWRWSRQKVGMSGEGALQSQEPGSSGAEAVASPHAPSFNMRYAKKVKLSTVLDQTEETEVPELTPDAYDRLLKNHQELVGRVPLPEAEPTEDQLAALQLRVIGRGGTPYADFAVLTPCGRRLQAALRARAWLLQTDGSYKAVIVPGPPDFTAWAACWRVYKAALLCLRYPVGETSTRRGNERLVVTVSALDEYFEAFRALCQELPEAWHLALAAEDRCRAEHFPRLRRTLTHADEQGRLPMNLEFLPHCNLGSVCSRRQQGTASTGRGRCAGQQSSSSQGAFAGQLAQVQVFPWTPREHWSTQSQQLEETHHRVQAVVNEGRGREAVNSEAALEKTTRVPPSTAASRAPQAGTA